MSRRGRNAVTLHQVAKHIGVAPMTVSRVLSGHQNVSGAMRQRVLAAVEALGYLPDAAARSLASAETLKIGVLYGNPSATFSSEFLVGLLENAAQLGCQLVLQKCSTPRTQNTAVAKLLRGDIDGVVLPTPLCDSKRLLEVFEQALVPTVAVGTGRQDLPGLSLRIDNFHAAQQMTRYLLGLGHRAIGFILGHASQIDSEQRYQGFAAALAEAEIPMQRKWVKQGQYTYRSGLLVAEQLLRGPTRPTAIFASNDDMAAGAVAAAHRLRLDVPRDLTIVGFDDTPLATTIWPTLTTIRQPVGELIQRSLELLLGEVRNRRRGEPPEQKQETMTLTLVKRESAAAPPR